MPLFKFFTPEPEGITIPACSFYGECDSVHGGFAGGFLVGAPTLASTPYFDGEFFVPACGMDGSCTSIDYCTGWFGVPAPSIAGACIVGTACDGEFGVSSPSISGDMLEIAAPEFAGSFAVELRFAGLFSMENNSSVGDDVILRYADHRRLL